MSTQTDTPTEESPFDSHTHGPAEPEERHRELARQLSSSCEGVLSVVWFSQSRYVLIKTTDVEGVLRHTNALDTDVSWHRLSHHNSSGITRMYADLE